ncbi:MAG: hypothetical protein QOF08_123 [Gaiellales bacterium]|nr:hypothetical protein [Gaiellales bacterium]
MIDETIHWPGSTGAPDHDDPFSGRASGPILAGRDTHQASRPAQQSAARMSSQRLPAVVRGAEAAISVITAQYDGSSGPRALSLGRGSPGTDSLASTRGV